jgi:hypothetical protein
MTTKKVTYTTLISGNGRVTRCQAFRAVLHTPKTKKAFIDLASAEKVAEILVTDLSKFNYYQFSKMHETAAYPAFDWDM